MSIQVGLYTKSKAPPTEDALAEQMAKEGWRIRFDDWGKHYPARATPLEDTIIAGWRAVNEHPLLDETLSKGNSRKTEKLYRENRRRYCLHAPRNRGRPQRRHRGQRAQGYRWRGHPR